MKMRLVAGAFVAAVAIPWIAPSAQAQPIPVNVSVGDFTYQFADPTTGVPISSLHIPTVGASARVALYLIQTGGTPTNLLQQLGLEQIGVRLNYASPAGIVKVPTAGAANITARPPPVFNPNGVSSDFDYIQRTGTGTGTDTTLSAAIVEKLYDPIFYAYFPPLPFPGGDFVGDYADPLDNKLRMLIGTFTLQGLAQGVESLTAVDPAASWQSRTGPNPLMIGERDDGTTGPILGNGAQGEVLLAQFLAENMATPVIPTLTVTVVVPEPSSLALFGVAGLAGLADWRRRKVATAAAPILPHFSRTANMM
jgi:PEP-CTERM motif